MPKKKLKKILPSYEKIQKQKFLKIFGNKITKRELWSLNRRKVLKGVFIGVFVACLPMPFQIVLACFLAILIGANLAISFILLFINNPLTIPAFFYVEYQVGKLIFQKKDQIEFDFNTIYENFDQIVLLLWSGALLVGIISALISMILVNSFWIYNIRRQRKKRKEKSYLA